MNAETLKPCPFCGGTNLSKEGGIREFISCTSCGTFGPDKEHPDTPEGAWNTRAADNIALQAEVESLNMQMSILSPLYSSRQALADENARLREALREVTQTLSWQCFGECRGFSDNLLEPSDAVAIARAALNN